MKVKKQVMEFWNRNRNAIMGGAFMGIGAWMGAKLYKTAIIKGGAIICERNPEVKTLISKLADELTKMNKKS